MTKYGNHKTVVDGITFDSKKEANRWCELKLMEKAGIIGNLERQVPFRLIPTQKDSKGKVLEREVVYYADFIYTQDGGWVVEDVKSSATRTKEYIIKRKLMLQVHGIRIREV